MLEEHSMRRSELVLGKNSLATPRLTKLTDDRSRYLYLQAVFRMTYAAATEAKCGQKKCMCLNAGSTTQPHFIEL